MPHYDAAQPLLATLNILFVSREYAPETGGGGVGSYVAETAAALARRGHEVHALSCAPGQRRSDDVRDGVAIHRRGTLALPFASPLLGHWASEHAAQALSAFTEYRRLAMSFDVVEVPDWRAEGLLFSLWAVPPVVGQLHCPLVLLMEHSGTPMTWADRCADYLERVSVHRVDVVTSPSYHLVADLRKRNWLRHARVRVLRIPLDTRPWERVAPVETSEPVILQVGRVDALKSPELLVQALARLERPRGTLALFAGRASGGTDAQVKRLADRLGVRCEFTGPVSRLDLPRYLSRARGVVLMSAFESFGVAVLEAMAASRPVVVSDRVGAKEILAGTGAGAVVRYGDAGALAAALAPLLNDAEHAAEVGRRGRQLVDRAAAPLALAAAREAVYREAISAWSGRASTAWKSVPP